MNLKRISVLFAISGVFLVLIFCGISQALTQDNDYDVVWNASDMPTGTFSEFNGLESVGNNDLDVTESSRYYEGMLYSKTIKTNGYTTTDSSYVPTKRALKFSVSKPCYMDILAYGTSSQLEETPLYISRKGSIISSFDLIHNDISLNTVYLDKADTYYIYCLTGSVGINFIHLYYKKGDLNADNVVNKDDLTMLYQIVYDANGFDSDTLAHADMDQNGVFNENDITLLRQIIRNAGEYVPTYYSDKTWTMDNYETGTVYSAETDVDGLVVVPKPSGSGKDLFIAEDEPKNYEEYTYTKYLATNGASKLNGDTVIKRGVKVYTSEPCYLTVLVRCASTNQNADPCLTISAKGFGQSENMLTKVSDLEKNQLEYVQVKLGGPNEYSISDKTGAINIYQIILSRSKITFLNESETDTIWNFDDDLFNNKVKNEGFYKFKETENIGELTFFPGTILHSGTGVNHIRGEEVYNYALLSKTTNYKSTGSISFYTKTSVDIYILAHTANNNYTRPLSIISDKMGAKPMTQYIYEADCYHFSYTGSDSRIYIYAPGDNIKIYRIAIVERDSSDYDQLPEERIWNFSESDIQGTFYKHTYYKGMDIFADEAEPVTVSYNSVRTNEGFGYYYNLSLTGDGNSSHRSVAFGVDSYSYVYITARVPAEGQTRQLIVTNKYGAEISTDLDSSYIDVDDSIKVYKFRYDGRGEKIYLRSADSQIRIYQIAVKHRIRTETEDVVLGFETMSPGTVLNDYNTDNVNISSPYQSSTVVSDPIEGYSNALSLYANGAYEKAGKIGFKMPDSSHNYFGAPRLISITAKGKGKKLHIANKYGYIYKSFDLSEEPHIYTYKYDEAGDYIYFYSNGSGSVEIYNIMSNDTDYIDDSEDNSYYIDFKAGEKVYVYLTAENVSALNRYNYSVTYNSAYLGNPDITFGPDIEDPSADSTVEYKDGELTFSLDNSPKQNWSGIIGVLTFKAINDGSNTIYFDIYKKGGAL